MEIKMVDMSVVIEEKKAELTLAPAADPMVALTQYAEILLRLENLLHTCPPSMVPFFFELAHIDLHNTVEDVQCLQNGPKH